MSIGKISLISLSTHMYSEYKTRCNAPIGLCILKVQIETIRQPNAKYKTDQTPLDKKTKIRDLNKYSKSYLNHLTNTNEILASMLISLHNINFYQEFMKEIRLSIKENKFDDFYKEYISKYN